MLSLICYSCITYTAYCSLVCLVLSGLAMSSLSLWKAWNPSIKGDVSTKSKTFKQFVVGGPHQFSRATSTPEPCFSSPAPPVKIRPGPVRMVFFEENRGTANGGNSVFANLRQGRPRWYPGTHWFNNGRKGVMSRESSQEKNTCINWDAHKCTLYTSMMHTRIYTMISSNINIRH